MLHVHPPPSPFSIFNFHAAYTPEEKALRLYDDMHADHRNRDRSQMRSLTERHRKCPTPSPYGGLAAPRFILQNP